jgi:hypothetical protein
MRVAVRDLAACRVFGHTWCVLTPGDESQPMWMNMRPGAVHLCQHCRTRRSRAADGSTVTWTHPNSTAVVTTVAGGQS